MRAVVSRLATCRWSAAEAGVGRGVCAAAVLVLVDMLLACGGSCRGRNCRAFPTVLILAAFVPAGCANALPSLVIDVVRAAVL